MSDNETGSADLSDNNGSQSDRSAHGASPVSHDSLHDQDYCPSDNESDSTDADSGEVGNAMFTDT